MTTFLKPRPQRIAQSRYRLGRAFVALVALVFLDPFGSDAQAAVGGQRKPAGAVLEEARTLARAKRFADLESLVREDSALGRETARWHLDLGQRLAFVAADLAQGADSAGATEVARLALRQAELSGGKAASDRDRAKAKAAAGKLYEVYLGDTNKAVESYAAAVTLDPSNKSAAADLNRLRASIANLKERLQANARK